MPQNTMILLVEDELPVRKFVSELLTDAGYSVVSASSGPDAIKAFNERNGKISLLVTDVDLTGGLSGVELAEYFENVRPDLKVLLMSGSPAPSVAFHDTKHFIRKPFAPVHLIEKVKAILSQEAGPLVRRDCGWIAEVMSRRYPQFCIECKEEHGNQYLLRVRHRPEAPAKDVRFSIREYLDGSWEEKVNTVVDSLDGK